MTFTTGFMIIAAAVVVVGIILLARHYEKKRLEALTRTANRLGLRFTPGKDRHLAHELEFLNQLREGSDRYASDLMRGSYSGHEVRIFDFHYERSSTDSDGNRSSTSYWHHLIVVDLPRAFPELLVSRENIFTRAAKLFGWTSIDFESAEFSRTFRVRSKDKRFAYDVVNPAMMEFLLRNKDLTLEIEGAVLAAIFDERMDPEQVGYDLERVIAVRNLMPDYLFDKERARR